MSEKVLCVKFYVISVLNSEYIVGTFYSKELQKINKTNLEIEKVNKGKCDKFYVKWTGYDNSFSSWMDKRRCCYIENGLFFTETELFFTLFS